MNEIMSAVEVHRIREVYTEDAIIDTRTYKFFLKDGSVIDYGNYREAEGVTKLYCDIFCTTTPRNYGLEVRL